MKTFWQKVLARRLNTVIGVITSDQTGFIPGHATAINLRCPFMNLQTCGPGPDTRVAVLLDTH